MCALMARLPNESFIYLGDTARLPYGTKSGDTVTRYAVQAARALTRHKVKMLVVACNTASAVALPALEEALAPIPIIGVVEPGAEAAVAAAPEGVIAVIATEGTVSGGAYPRAIHARAPNAQVVQQACPLFVPLAEEGLIDSPIAKLTAEHYLRNVFTNSRPRALVLGCTHFPVLKNIIAEIAGPGVALVDSAQTTAEAVAKLLADKNLTRAVSGAPKYEYFATDSTERFARVGRIFLGRTPDNVELVDI